MRRIATTGMLIAALLAMGGCASTVALIDTAAALKVVDEVNVDNWTRVRTAQLAFLDGETASLEAKVEDRIRSAKTGADAAVIFQQYRTARTALADRRGAVAAEYGEALANAFLATELRDRMEKILAGWSALLGRIPGVETAKTLAAAKARKWIAGQEPVAGSP